MCACLADHLAPDMLECNTDVPDWAHYVICVSAHPLEQHMSCGKCFYTSNPVKGGKHMCMRLVQHMLHASQGASMPGLIVADAKDVLPKQIFQDPEQVVWVLSPHIFPVIKC